MSLSFTLDFFRFPDQHVPKTMEGCETHKEYTYRTSCCHIVTGDIRTNGTSPPPPSLIASLFQRRSYVHISNVSPHAETNPYLCRLLSVDLRKVVCVIFLE